MYKGFKITDKKLMCRDFEYKEGETYEIDKANEIKLCKKGFHACENPLDCFAYYLPATSVYHEVELAELSQEISTDSKRVGAKITIGKLLDIPSIIDAVINLRVQSTLQGGDWSALQGGSRSALRGGHGSALQGGHGSTLQGGEGSALQGGDKSVVYGQGNTCKVKGGILSVLAILYTYANGDQAVEHTIVDGEKIKANTWYMYDGEEFIETSLG